MNILSKNYELMEKYREKAENEFCDVVDCRVVTDLYVIDYHNDNSVEPNNKLPWQALANIAKLPNQWN